MKRGFLLAAWVFCAGAGARAEDVPVRARTPDLTRVDLLEEAPNYAQALVEQWRSGVRTEENEVGRVGRSYGLLVEAGQERSITLEESIALALKNNTGLKIRYLDPIAAAAGVREARAIFDPQFFGDASKNHSSNQVQSQNPFISTGPRRFYDEVDFGAGLRKTLLSGGLLSLDWTNKRIAQSRNVASILRPYYQTELNLSLNQPLLRGFGWRYTLLLVDVAENTEEQAFYQYRAGLADLVKEVERSYWALVLAIQNVKVEEQGLELAKELLRQNEGRFKVGALPRTSVLEAQAEVAQREAQLVNSRNLMQNSHDGLRAVINARDPGSEFLMMIEPADVPTVVPYDVDLERSLKSASEDRPELIAARLDVHGKRLQRKIAENQILPKLDFVGSIGLNGLGGEDKGPINLGGAAVVSPNPQVVGGYDRSLEFLADGRYYQYAAGAKLEVPIANAQAKADYAQAKIDTERAWLSLHQLEENVTLEVKTAVSNVQSDLKSIEATRIARELAQENLRNQQARYDVGLATTKDIVDYQDRLTQAQRQEIVALTRYNINLAELRRVEGTLLAARNVVVERPEREGAPWWARF